MNIAILGGQGMLAQEMLWRWQDEHTVFPLARCNIDILESPESIAEKLKKLAPDVVINCAGFTHVEHAEIRADDATAINAFGAENVAKACALLDIPVVYISTDYVFDGKKKTPYLEEDRTNGLSVYGRSKEMGEKLVQAAAKRHFIVRTSWLYGAYGPNFVATMQHLLRTRRFVSVVSDQIGTPTWTRDLTDAVLAIITGKHEYGIYHCSNSGETSWAAFAEAIAKLDKRAKAEIEPIPSSEYAQKAERPMYSVLKNTKLPPLRDWKEALMEFLAEK